ncbi:MAG: DEAD/DEAH box helicase, partial [Syntrophobacteraceae bacterium]|nr:DEAD/DEAH box helicase [Syntrophobacteraceae bacterium]
HKLFLTATPHNGYRESFSALLELLDNQRFSRGTEPDRRQLEAARREGLKVMEV